MTHLLSHVSFIAVLGLLGGGLVLADRPTPTGPSPMDPHAQLGVGDCGDDSRIWEQLPDDVNALTSMDDATYPFQIEVADDFAGSAESLIGIGYWGAFDQGSPAPIDGFRVRIYSAGTDTLPQDLLFDQDVVRFQELGGDPIGYCLGFSEPFEMVPGTTYWVSVVARLAFPPQWGWSTGTGNGVGVAVRSDFFNLPDWERGIDLYDEVYDTAFFLYVTSTPLAEATWGTIKSHYRQGDE